jgi:branched-chain amino acid transport system ATP-binding protein
MTQQHSGAPTAGQPTPPALSAQGIRACYGELVAVHDASVEVARAEIVALIGPNGAGKTTLLQTIIGAVPARSGRVLLDGVEVTTASSKRRVAAGCALVPEGRRLFLGMTVLDNLYTGARGASRREVRARLELVYEFFPKLRQLRDKHAGTLSGGEQQMCAIGRALMAKPKVMLIDELSLGLAPVAADDLADRLIRLTAESGSVSVVVVDQDTVRCKEMANRMYSMFGGQTAGGGLAAEMELDALSLWGSGPGGLPTPGSSAPSVADGSLP